MSDLSQMSEYHQSVAKLIGEGPLLSRTGAYNPLGKCICTLKTSVPMQVEIDVQAKAAALGMPTQEFLRELIMINLYGENYVVSLHEQRIKRVAAIGPSKWAV